MGAGGAAGSLGGTLGASGSLGGNSAPDPRTLAQMLAAAVQQPQVLLVGLLFGMDSHKAESRTLQGACGELREQGLMHRV